MAARRSATAREIFLSHASGDRALADAVAGSPRAHGLPVWYSKTNIQGAQQWHDEIGSALERCDWFLVLLTKHLSWTLGALQFVDLADFEVGLRALLSRWGMGLDETRVLLPRRPRGPKAAPAGKSEPRRRKNIPRS